MAEYEELRAQHAVDEAECRRLEQELNQIDYTKPNWSRLRGVEPVAGADPFGRDSSPVGSAAYAADHVSRRRAWLEQRHQEYAARAVRRTVRQAERHMGVTRFLPDGRFSLQQIVEPERQRRARIWKAAGTILFTQDWQRHIGPLSYADKPKRRGEKEAD
jgi:hypothetical protein